MIIGLPKEIKNIEFRVGLTPGAVSAFVQAGHQVLVERAAGTGSGFSDREYQEAGAHIRDSAGDVWSESGPDRQGQGARGVGVPLLPPGPDLYTYLHLAADGPLTLALLDSGVKAIAYETIVGRNGGLPCLAP